MKLGEDIGTSEEGNQVLHGPLEVPTQVAALHDVVGLQVPDDPLAAT